VDFFECLLQLVINRQESRWCEVPQPDDIAFVPTALCLCLPALLGSLRIVREAERPIVQRR
jgi:hypothetical protein